MISEAAITTMCSILATTVLGVLIGLLVMVKKFKEKGVATAFFLGALGFFISQIVLRMPILNVISGRPAFDGFVSSHYILYSFLLALSTGFFEMVGRWFVLRYMMKGRITYHKAFSAGYGHGGVEAMFILGYSLINNIVAAVLINNGLIEDAMKDTGAAQSDIDTLIDTVVNTKMSSYYCDLAERVLFLCIQVMLTVLLGYLIMKGREVFGMLVTMFIHTMVNFVPGVVEGMMDGSVGSGISQTTGYIILFAYLIVVTYAMFRFVEKLKPQMDGVAAQNGFIKAEEKKQFPKFQK